MSEENLNTSTSVEENDNHQSEKVNDTTTYNLEDNDSLEDLLDSDYEDRDELIEESLNEIENKKDVDVGIDLLSSDKVNEMVEKIKNMDNKQRNNLMKQLSSQFNLNLNNTSYSSINKEQAVKQRLKKKLLIRRKARVQSVKKTNNVNQVTDNSPNKDIEKKNNNERNRKNKLRKKMKRLRRKELTVKRTSV